MSPVIEAVIALEDQALALDSLLAAFDDLAGDNVPSWLFTVQDKVRGLNAALEAVSKVARVQS